jgi:hypothetical protein
MFLVGVLRDFWYLDWENCLEFFQKCQIQILKKFKKFKIQILKIPLTGPPQKISIKISPKNLNENYENNKFSCLKNTEEKLHRIRINEWIFIVIQ